MLMAKTDGSPRSRSNSFIRPRRPKRRATARRSVARPAELQSASEATELEAVDAAGRRARRPRFDIELRPKQSRHKERPVVRLHRFRATVVRPASRDSACRRRSRGCRRAGAPATPSWSVTRQTLVLRSNVVTTSDPTCRSLMTSTDGGSMSSSTRSRSAVRDIIGFVAAGATRPTRTHWFR